MDVRDKVGKPDASTYDVGPSRGQSSRKHVPIEVEIRNELPPMQCVNLVEKTVAKALRSHGNSCEYMKRSRQRNCEDD
jgi:hypothetical protein